jgi:peptide/nickel transport system permease protein
MRGLNRFFSHWQNWVGVFLLLVYAVLAVAAPVLSPQDLKNPGSFLVKGRVNERQPQPPSATNPLGTLPGQVDVFHTIVWGAGDALTFSFTVVFFTALFGVIYGAVAGYLGGWINGFLMRIADAFLAFPVIAGVVFFQQLVNMTIATQGGYYLQGELFGMEDYAGKPTFLQTLFNLVDPLMLSLILFSWMPYSRMINAIIITLKNTEFIQAARALGASPFRVIFRHLIPNSISPAIVLVARDIGNVVLFQATLTFIHIGGNSPWGELLYMGRNWVIGPNGNLFKHWWVFVPATLAVLLFGIAWNLIGDGLTEAFEPSTAAHENSSFYKLKQKKAKVETQAQTALLEIRPELNPIVASKRPSISPVTENDSLLQVARDAIAGQNMDQAMHAYSHLLQHHRHISEIRHDLVQLARQFPRHAIIWTLLGDALTQEGNREYASKAYEQARNLTQ